MKYITQFLIFTLLQSCNTHPQDLTKAEKHLKIGEHDQAIQTAQSYMNSNSTSNTSEAYDIMYQAQRQRFLSKIREVNSAEPSLIPED